MMRSIKIVGREVEEDNFAKKIMAKEVVNIFRKINRTPINENIEKMIRNWREA